MATKKTAGGNGTKKAMRRLSAQLESVSERLDALEARLSTDAPDDAQSVAASAGTAGTDSSAPERTSRSTAARTDAARADQESPTVTVSEASGAPGDLSHVIPADEQAPADPFWALRALKALLPDSGGTVYAVAAETPRGRIEYQWGRPADHLLERDWSEAADALGALGHPLRLAILRLLTDTDHTVAQLVDELQLGSTGVAYHHLSALQTGGWVTSPRRGVWSIPPTRAASLLTILTTLETP